MIRSVALTPLRNTFGKFCVRPFLWTLCEKSSSKSYSRSRSPGSKIASIMTEIMKVNKNAPPPTIKIHVLGNGGLGNPSCVYVFTDNKRYLFNCGEGMQRLATELKLKLTKVDDVFLTRATWDKFGGLPGLSMTLKAIDTTKLTLHGPSNLVELYEMTKYFGVDSSLNVSQHDYNKSNFRDSVMEVQRIELSYKDDNSNPNSLKKQKVTSENDVFCYICNFHEKPGELMIKKCMELKVPPGPLLGKLKSGEDVTLPDGRTIFSKDVVGKAEKGPMLFIIDCPSKLHFNKLLNSDVLSENQQICVKNDILSTVVHFSPSHLVNSDEYQKFISSFPENSSHIYINEKCPSLSNVAPYDLQAQLNMVDSEIFPLLKHSSDNDENNKQHSTGFQVILRPKTKAGVFTDSVVNFDPKAVINEALRIHELPEAISDYKEKCAELKIQGSKYPQIIFVGTCSASPGKYRNSSCILVNIDSDTSIMLDCGEGSFGQLTRLFGHEIKDELKKLKAIYVSHYHADHQLGIIDILRNRETLNVPPLPLIVPITVSNWLNLYSNSYESINHLYKVYDSNSFRSPNSSTSLLNSLKLKSLDTVKVPHCKDSLGIIFTTDTEPSYKIVYSGDAMPSSSLISHGKNCDVLIHEATMEDDLHEEAHLKRHSTMSQAIKVGWDMNAKKTILTHFSQRYSKIPLLPESSMENVGIAFDNMRISLSELDKLPILLKPLKVLLQDEYQEMLERTSVRIQRKQVFRESVS